MMDCCFLREWMTELSCCGLLRDSDSKSRSRESQEALDLAHLLNAGFHLFPATACLVRWLRPYLEMGSLLVEWHLRGASVASFEALISIFEHVG